MLKKKLKMPEYLYTAKNMLTLIKNKFHKNKTANNTS